MKFGKLADISNVDFSLPPDDAGTTRFLEHLPERTEPPKIYVGCTGWGMKEWVGKTYPKGAKAKEFLNYYIQQFNTIELNTTHYRTPDKETIYKWKAAASGRWSDFKFCPKVLQVISHSKELGVGTGRIERFCESVSGLEKNLGCSFLQLPPYFGGERLPMLERFLEHFDNAIPLAIEIRHESWFTNRNFFESIFKLFEKYNISTVISDVAGRRDVLHQRLTTDTAMVRFVGNDLVESDFTRIDDWVSRLKIWMEKGLREIYFFTHEPDNILAPELAYYFVKKVQSVCAHLKPEIRGPKFYEANNNEQMSLF